MLERKNKRKAVIGILRLHTIPTGHSSPDLRIILWFITWKLKNIYRKMMLK